MACLRNPGGAGALLATVLVVEDRDLRSGVVMTKDCRGGVEVELQVGDASAKILVVEDRCWRLGAVFTMMSSSGFLSNTNKQLGWNDHFC